MYTSVYRLITQMIHDMQPDLVICESPYMDKRFPLSYMLLSLCSQAVQQAVKDYSTFIPFEFIDPASAKKGVGAKGNNGDKELMRQAVLSCAYITGGMDLTRLDEHTIDSIAIGYNGFLGILNK
jgi:Holliday junction resolvasome RuvABC endonuclease subunit